MKDYIAEVIQSEYGEAVVLKKELIHCRDCKHRPKLKNPEDVPGGINLIFPDERCPGLCDDPYYSWMPDDDWHCRNGEREER